MQTIPLYTGPAAQAALRGEVKERVNRDTFEAANQFRLARYLTEDAK